MPNTQSSSISLPGGLPIQRVTRFAIRNRSGNLTGYAERVTLTSWSLARPLVTLVQGGTINFSASVEIYVEYSGDGRLKGGWLKSEGRTYQITPNGAVYSTNSSVTPNFPDYGAFAGSDFVGAAGEGAGRAANPAGQLVIGNLGGAVAKTLDFTSIAAAAASGDTVGVITEGAGATGALLGGVGGYALATAGNASPLGRFVIAAGGAFIGNSVLKDAAKSLTPEYRGYTYYDGSPFVAQPGTDPITQPAGWYRVAPAPERGVFSFSGLADAETASELTARRDLVRAVETQLGPDQVGNLARMNNAQLAEFIRQNPGYEGSALIWSHLSRASLGSPMFSPNIPPDLPYERTVTGSVETWKFENGVFRVINRETGTDTWVVPNAEGDKTGFYQLNTVTGAASYWEYPPSDAAVAQARGGEVVRPSLSAFFTPSSPFSVVVNDSPDGVHRATVSHLVALQRAAGNNITADDVLFANPSIGPNFVIYPNQTILIPIKGADGSILVSYADGSRVNYNPQTRAAQWVIADASGNGYTVYITNPEGDFGRNHLVRRVDSSGRTIEETEWYSDTLDQRTERLTIERVDPNSGIRTRTETVPQPDGRLMTREYDVQGGIRTERFTRHVSTDDEGNQTTETQWRDGTWSYETKDPQGKVVGRITDTPSPDGGVFRTVETTVDGRLVRIQQTGAAGAGRAPSAGGFTTNGMTVDGQPQSEAAEDLLPLLDLFLEDDDAFDDFLYGDVSGGLGETLDAISPANPGGVPRQAPGQPSSLEQLLNSADFNRFASSLSDFTNLLAAIKGGRSLTIASSAFNFAQRITGIPEIASAAAALGARSGSSRLCEAVRRGDRVRTQHSIRLCAGSCRRKTTARTIANYRHLTTGECRYFLRLRPTAVARTQGVWHARHGVQMRRLERP